MPPALLQGLALAYNILQYIAILYFFLLIYTWNMLMVIKKQKKTVNSLK
jgi:hypothetical protein